MPDLLLAGLDLLEQRSGWLLVIGLLLAGMINLLKWRLDIRRATSFAGGFQELQPLPGTEMVSVLVAAWNEQAHLEKHIHSFLDLRYARKELILCAGGEDASYAIACRYAAENVTVLEQQPGEGKQGALRRCFGLARGAVIFLTDADCVLDNASFERTIQPVLLGQELATTGASWPLEDQSKDIFALSQAIPQLYGNLHQADYAQGILGRNCALRADLLAQTASLEQPAPSGTDYVLAKTLLRQGARIRHVPHSLVRSAFPAKPAEYMRQQRRWARNVFRHGKRLGAAAESRAVLKNSLVGLSMLVLPGIFPGGPGWIGAAWVVLFWHALLSRLRYTAAVRRALALPMPFGVIIFQPCMLLIDFCAWARALLDFFTPSKQEGW